MSPYPPAAALIPVAVAATTLFPSFFAFDAIVKREYDLHREAWDADGRPSGMFWRPAGYESLSRRERRSSGRATQRLMSVWLFRSPAWARDDVEAIRLLRRMRWFWVAWCVGVVALMGLAVVALPR